MLFFLPGVQELLNSQGNLPEHYLRTGYSLLA
jgi:hypothetical protein